MQVELVFFDREHGGRLHPPWSGFRPQIKAGELFTSCVVSTYDDSTEFEFGRSLNAYIEFVFAEAVGSPFKVGDPVELFEGARRIAQGVVVAVS